MVQDSPPGGDQVLLLSGFKCAKTRVPGGTKGALMQSYFPKKQAYADSFGFNLV